MHENSKKLKEVKADHTKKKDRQTSKSYHKTKNLQKQVARTKQFIGKVLDEDASLLERICTFLNKVLQ